MTREIKVKENEKRAIKFDDTAFNSAMQSYKDKLHLEEHIIQEIKSVLGNETNIPSELFSDLMPNVYGLIEDKYKKENTLSLNGLKLAGLMDINLEKIKSLSAKHYPQKDILEPVKEDFTKYATTKEQIARLELAESMLNLVGVAEDNGLRSIPFHVQSSFSPSPIYFDRYSNKFEPNLFYIYNSFR
jgi:hypothetical protein